MKMVCNAWRKCDNPCSDKYPHDINALCAGECESQYHGRCIPAISTSDDVTMDCTKCKAHIEAETLKKAGEWLGKRYNIYHSAKDSVMIRLDDIAAFERGEMP